MSEDERLPVIWEKGVKTFGDEEMMSTMIQNFEPMSFDGVMKDLSAAILTENWPEVKRNAHTMKGSSSYIGADRFSEVCLLLQNAAMAVDIPEIYSSYDKVLKEGKILKNYLAKLLEKTPDTTEIDKYISEFEKLKKSKKINVGNAKEKENKPNPVAKQQPEKEKAAPEKKNTQTSKKQIEVKNESSQPLKNEKQIEDVVPGANATNNNQNQARGILESGEASADKACCKQCSIF